jgi:flagellar L-ring protein precursor FlgH
MGERKGFRRNRSREKMKKTGLWIPIIFYGMTAIGCGVHTKNTKAPVEPVRSQVVSPLQLEPRPEGSLWNGSATASLFSDIKAHKVGDIVTISIVESSSATESASTDASRESSVEAGIDAFLGYEKWVMERNRNFNASKMLDANLSNEFKGSGKTVRSGTLTASITARIIEVLSNGNFIIEGRREVEVNHEAQYIVISGIVRPEDISRDNMVLSTFIADARIAYSGRGIINDHQYPGWFTRLLNKAWPF